MRNWRELTQEEIKEMGELFPHTPNRELAAKYDISIEAIRKKLAKIYGWKKVAKPQDMASRVILTEQQEEWIIKHYKHTANIEIVKKFGIGEYALHKFAKKHNLRKSRQHLKKCKLQSVEKGQEVSRKYGVYEENSRRAKQQWKERKLKGDTFDVGFQKGVTHKDRLSQEKYQQLLIKMSVSRKEIFRKERMRVKWGLEQKTNLRIVSGGRKRAYRRNSFRKRGYIVGYASNYVYYTDETKRSLKAESRAHEVGLKILPYKEAI